MKTVEIIANKKLHTSEEIAQLKTDVKIFLNKMEPSRSEIVAQRSELFPSPFPGEILFRSREHSEKTMQILQHLVYFLDHVPESVEDENRPLNPIRSFMECVRFEVDLLLAEDVKDAVFNEINKMGSTNGDNVWDYMGRIIEKNRELNEALITGTSDEASNLFTLCLVLEDLCLFWFDVKRQNMRRIRLSDILIFKLARILQDRCRRT